MKDFLAISGAVLITVSTIPYIVDIFRKKTRPNIVTWITWTLLTSIATAATFAAHEPLTALLTLGSALSTGFVVIAGLWHGFAKLTYFDVACQLGALVGLLLWFLFDSPTVAIVAAVTIDFIGFLPTLGHSWRLPGEETWQTFAWSTFAVALTLLGLSSYTLASLVYPVYLFVADGILVVVILTRRQRLTSAHS